MPTVINTNMASLLAQNSLSGAQNALAGSVQRLSSGLRINAAKDDAAGLAISQNMQSQINGINQSIRNLTDATNLIQTADSSLGTVQDMLLRMKTLAVQGFNGSLSSQQRSNLVDELRQLNDEINNTAIRTRFNGNNLISSDVASSGGTTSVNITGTTGGSATITASKTVEGDYTFSASNGKLIASNGRGATDTATLVQVTSSSVASYYFNDFAIEITVTGGSGTAATIANQETNLATLTLNTEGSASEEYTFQSGPDNSALTTFNTIDVKTYGTTGIANSKMTVIGDTLTSGGSLYTAQSAWLANSSATAVNTWDNAFKDLSGYLDDAIDWISDKRSVFGAQINRIAYISENLEAYTTNLQSTRSAIIDTDFAAETARLTKGQIMQQAATAMLAQANQMPNVILSLLK
ncbi:flagellin [Polynucleobacter sp. MWH-UH24A]|uniref:flagellin N-terminal helical domain-containing protein n=1 Tax=Polynucleobacter sp. MWH-UH24A TaxID=2689110 RepID=UPI001BFE2293|nr:flagellin [Polynucleobacter sp. MWH-UH24A]QWD75664.1 flagellin [Polynucleobacter sp. MWH-UH24A]